MTLWKSSLFRRGVDPGAVPEFEVEKTPEHIAAFGASGRVIRQHTPDLPDVPALSELADSAEDNRILGLLASTEDMGRAFAAGPKVPADRVAFLRAAFAKMMMDPDFLRESAKRNFEIAFMPGEELQDLAVSIGRFSPELAAKAKKVLMP